MIFLLVRSSARHNWSPSSCVRLHGFCSLSQRSQRGGVAWDFLRLKMLRIWNSLSCELIYSPVRSVLFWSKCTAYTAFLKLLGHPHTNTTENTKDRTPRLHYYLFYVHINNTYHHHHHRSRTTGSSTIYQYDSLLRHTIFVLATRFYNVPRRSAGTITTSALF